MLHLASQHYIKKMFSASYGFVVHLGDANIGNIFPKLMYLFFYSRLESSSSEWMDPSAEKSDCDAGLYKSHCSMSVCSVASTFLPSLPPDSFSTTSTTHIGEIICLYSRKCSLKESFHQRNLLLTTEPFFQEPLV